MRVLARYGWISLLGDNWKETKSIDGLIGSLEGAEFVAYPKHKTCLSTFQASWDIELETAIKAVPRGYSDVHLAHFSRRK